MSEWLATLLMGLILGSTVRALNVWCAHALVALVLMALIVALYRERKARP